MRIDAHHRNGRAEENAIADAHQYDSIAKDEVILKEHRRYQVDIQRQCRKNEGQ